MTKPVVLPRPMGSFSRHGRAGVAHGRWRLLVRMYNTDNILIRTCVIEAFIYLFIPIGGFSFGGFYWELPLVARTSHGPSLGAWC